MFQTPQNTVEYNPHCFLRKRLNQSTQQSMKIHLVELIVNLIVPIGNVQSQSQRVQNVLGVESLLDCYFSYYIRGDSELGLGGFIKENPSLCHDHLVVLFVEIFLDFSIGALADEALGN